jgi:hypothetical protein
MRHALCTLTGDKMSKIETIDIGKFKVTVKELTPRDILDILDGVDENNLQVEELTTLLNEHLDKAVNLKLEDFLDIPPSDIKRIYEKFKEVNKVFFDMAGWMGMDQILARAKEAFVQDVSKLFVNLSKPDT